MIVSFMDLLGFSRLLEKDVETAYEVLDQFNRIIKRKIIDQKNHPADSYDDKDLQEFVRMQEVNSFTNMISISDSLIIGADDPNIFLNQLCYFISSAFIESNEPFRKPITDINTSKKRYYGNLETGIFTEKVGGAFPILFRGGIAVGEAIFSPELQIYNGEAKQYGLNVTGQAYLQAVKLENLRIKGPRLLCKQEFYDLLSTENKTKLSIVSEEDKLYEVNWTVWAFEVLDRSSIKIMNINQGLRQTLLQPAVNLYNYFNDNEEGVSIHLHYLELIRLIYRGAVTYSQIHDLDQKRVLDLFKVETAKLNGITFDEIIE
ncbi:hypothetical protein J40TS1_46410 [Paenibacillus montaniterrae]|uniref:Uncharacterized protein n=1 Tax=Paenibacillus montaniterrae TaxID=429341 RepID=A0A920D1J5_9BACL|nr:hypothetical protein [Paenibacillus montaniterrae]GIP18999.1 hypothetical protein J40TS1_46410 [Paenibacillus montaniterrae]